MTDTILRGYPILLLMDHRLETLDPRLIRAMEDLVEPTTRGDPESPLRWTCKSTRKLAAELTAQGHPISRTRVATLLTERGYSLQSNRKTPEGSQHPDRHAQFERINACVQRRLAHGQPTISGGCSDVGPRSTY